MPGLILPPGPIPVLTLYACWAASIAYGEPFHAEEPALTWLKDHENRPWPLPSRLVRQPIAIHAGAYPFGPGSWSARASEEAAFRKTCERAGCRVPSEIPTRQIAAFVICDPSVKSSSSPWFCGPWGTPFAEVWRLPQPVTVERGAQRIWRLKDGREDAALRALASQARRVK